MDKVVVVTGMAAGIGKVVTEKFLEEGSVVYGLDIAEVKTEDLQAADKSKFHYFKANATSSKDVKAVFDDIREKYNRVDILVNNVGGFTQIKYCEDLEEEEWDMLIDLNLKSCYLACKYALPLMKEQKSGRIINMSSIAGRQPVGRSNVAYASSKGAIVAITRYLALEVAPWNITVNAVSPITTLTPRVRKSRSEEDQERIAKTIPLGRLGEPEDTTDAVMFFASDKAGFITGITLDVNGGTFAP